MSVLVWFVVSVVGRVGVGVGMGRVRLSLICVAGMFGLRLGCESFFLDAVGKLIEAKRGRFAAFG